MIAILAFPHRHRDVPGERDQPGGSEPEAGGSNSFKLRHLSWDRSVDPHYHYQYEISFSNITPVTIFSFGSVSLASIGCWDCKFKAEFVDACKSVIRKTVTFSRVHMKCDMEDLSSYLWASLTLTPRSLDHLLRTKKPTCATWIALFCIPHL